MVEEENFKNSLTAKFTFLEGRIKTQRDRRIVAEVEYRYFFDVFNYAVKELGFSILCTITGLDEIQNFTFIYHLARIEGTVLNIKTRVPRDNPVINSITGIFPNADIYEREIADLLGVSINGLADGIRYPLPDDWPKGEYPLRKDWKKPSHADNKREV